ncbi:MAG: type II toxin-antitoxin system prevent-host-death family antitoxin [Spirochaetota bacterium]|nr:type II toxin-antitoxin system prevent-host-death family antitoxin [Spirochaetota bacterium]
MEYLQFTDFRNHSKKYFEKIQEGESFIIVKKGSPVARIIPFNENIQGWKRSVSRVKLKNTQKTTIDFISEERNDR